MSNQRSTLWQRMSNVNQLFKSISCFRPKFSSNTRKSLTLIRSRKYTCLVYRHTTEYFEPFCVRLCLHTYKMVCVPCFIVPLLLFIWHKFIQPYVLKIWNPWAKDPLDQSKVENPFKCENGVCVFKKWSNKEDKHDNAGKETCNEEVPSPDSRLKAE